MAIERLKELIDDVLEAPKYPDGTVKDIEKRI